MVSSMSSTAPRGRLISAKNYVSVNWASGIDPPPAGPIENPAARYAEKPVRDVSIGARRAQLASDGVRSTHGSWSTCRRISS